MQTTIYLIRHGEVKNPKGIIYGRLPNFDLSEIGKQQVEEAAEFLKDKHIDEIYTGPLDRVQQTAKIMQKKLKLPEIHVSQEITEIQTSYEGKKFSALDKLQSEVYVKPLDPSDETIEQLAQRMMIFLHGVTNINEGKHIVIISHGDPIMALKAKISNKPLDISFKKENYIQHAEIYEIQNENNKLSLKSVFKPTIY